MIYEVELNDGEVISLENPAKLPEANKITEIREPIIEASILVPQDYVGAVIGLCEEKRGRAESPAIPGRPGIDSVTSCRCRKSSSISSIA